MESRRPDVLTTIRAKMTDGKAYNDLAEMMKSALTEYNKEFAAQGGGAGGKAAAAPQA
jgi:hypothetical protein